MGMRSSCYTYTPAINFRYMSGEQNLKLMSYNIQGMFWKPEYSKRLAELVKRRKIHVLCLQEVIREYSDDKDERRRNITKEIAEALGDRYRAEEYLCVQDAGESMGNATFYDVSRLTPMGGPVTRHFEFSSMRSPFEHFITGKFVFPARRVALMQKFRMGKVKIILYNVHLDFLGGDGKKIFQFKRLFKSWDPEREDPDVFEIIAGDFNTWNHYLVEKARKKFNRLDRFMKGEDLVEFTKSINWTTFFNTELAIYGMDRGKIKLNRKLFDRVLSRFSGLVRQKTDHVWVSRGTERLNINKLHGVKLSDHYPILVEMKFKERDL